MQWPGLILWLLVAGLATLLLLVFTFSMTVHSLTAVTATMLWIVFCIVGSAGFAWAAVGLAVVSLLAAGIGSAGLVESGGSERAVRQTTEEHLTTFAGVQVVLLAVTIVISI